jgi:hypothetical protein
MKSEELKQQIRELIAGNDLESAIGLLANCYQHSEQRDAVLLQSAKYYELRKAYRDGFIDFESFQQKMNHLRASILEYTRQEQAEPIQNSLSKSDLKSDFKRSIARISILYLLSSETYRNTGLSITQIHVHSRRKSRRYIAECVLELEAHRYLEKTLDKNSKINLWKLTEEGWRLAEELKDSLFRQ